MLDYQTAWLVLNLLWSITLIGYSLYFWTLARAIEAQRKQYQRTLKRIETNEREKRKI
jgi:hypothetical protein